jgi:hypothetical protein
VIARHLVAVLALTAGASQAQVVSTDVLGTMRATLVAGPQKVRLAGKALDPFQPLFRAAGREVPVMGETQVLKRTSQQPPCGRVSMRLTPVGITGKSPTTGATEQAFWDVAYDLCAEGGPAPDALARTSPATQPPASLMPSAPAGQPANARL